MNKNDDNPLTNDFGTYFVVDNMNKVVGSIGLGEDEHPSTIIALLREELKSKLEVIPALLQRLDGCTVQVVDQSEFHSDLRVIDPEEKVLFALQYN